MEHVFTAVRVTERVYWVGAIDWGLRDFHGYSTDRGTTYNAYLVLGKPATLIDTVKAPFLDEMMARIASVCDPADIRYVVSNHAEMDHSGCLPAVIERLKPDRVLASAKGVEALAAHFGLRGAIEAVKDGQSLSLGGLSLTFYETPMLHWPDSMVTMLAEDQVLFSQDAFGMHLATGERFAEELPEDLLHYEAAKYFANILLPYAPRITRAIERLAGLGFSVIAPDHGPVWRGNLGRIVQWYADWAKQRPTAKAVIVYDTMWGSTEKMARAIAEGVADGGAAVSVLSLKANSRSAVATELLGAGALVVGSPTLNNQVYPTVADVLTYLKGLRPRNLIGAAFGSHGWSGDAVRQMNEWLDAMRVERVGDGVATIYVPDAEALLACRRLGTDIAAQLKARCTQ